MGDLSPENWALYRKVAPSEFTMAEQPPSDWATRFGYRHNEVIDLARREGVVREAFWKRPLVRKVAGVAWRLVVLIAIIAVLSALSAIAQATLKFNARFFVGWFSCFATLWLFPFARPARWSKS